MRFCNHYRYFFLTLFLLYRSPVGVCKSGGVLNYRDLRTVSLHANESTNILFSTMLRTEYTATMQRVCTTIQAKWKSRRSSRNSGNESTIFFSSLSLYWNRCIECRQLSLVGNDWQLSILTSGNIRSLALLRKAVPPLSILHRDGFQLVWGGIFFINITVFLSKAEFMLSILYTIRCKAVSN